MIGDTLVKLAKQEPISSIEVKELKLWGERRSESNEFLDSIRNGTGTVRVNHIRGLAGTFRWLPRGLSSKIRFSATVPNTGNTAVTFTESVYDDIGGFTAGSTTFSFRKRFWVKVNIFCDWQVQSGGPRRLFSPSYDSTHSPYASPITSRFFLTTTGNGFSMRVAQRSSATLTCSGTIRFQLIDKWIGVVD